jgi:hypothetical protein
MPDDGLNWKPGPDTNSIAAQIAHALQSATFWLQAAVGADSDRRAYLIAREAALAATGDGPALRSKLDAFDAEAPHLLARLDPASLDELRDWPGYWDGMPVSAAWCMLHALEHLREHLGSSALTRQLWEQRNQR